MDLLKRISAIMLGKKEINLLGNKVTWNKFFLVTLLFITLYLSGCVTLPDPETSQDYNQTQVAVISPGYSVGQTFVSRRARLNIIDLWLGDETPNVSMQVELFHKGDLTNPVFTTTVGARGGKIRIQIDPLDEAPNQHYYLRLSTNQGEIGILGRNESNYAHGNAFVNDQPVEADLAFYTFYEYDTNSAFTDLRGLLSNWYLILPLGIVLVLPGWLLLDFCGLKNKFDFGEKIALSLGLSFSLIPLLMLWTSLLGLQWGTISLWLIAGILIATFLWSAFKKTDRLLSFSFKLHPSTLILLAIFAITLFTRFAMARDLAAPPWVDSIHHGLITRLMLESGGIPDTYAPYLPLEAEYYHFGFHSALSSFIWLTGYEIQHGMLFFGQVLNAMIVFAVYLLAKTLTKNRPAALTAALIAGVFTLMPAYYLSWGRYTQLAGLLVLPASFRFFVEISKDKSILPNKAIHLWLPGAITFAGLFLIHYRVAAFLGVLILAYLIAQINPSKWLNTISQLATLGSFSVILILPWLPGTLSKLLIPKGAAWTGGKESFSQIPWHFLKPGMGETALIMAGIGLLLGVILLKRFPITILLWTGTIYLLANMGIFKLPGSGFVNPVSMEITLFMPIAISGGFAIGGILEILDKFAPQRWKVAPRVLLVILGGGASVLGAQRLLPTLNPITFLAREADFPAINWISENIPKGEAILINPTGWGYGLYMGQDGGYWISSLTEHQTLPPPVLYGLGKPDENKRINQLIESVLPIGEDAAALWELLQSENIHFVYTGGRGGILSPQALMESELFEVRYQQEGTWVFETSNISP